MSDFSENEIIVTGSEGFVGKALCQRLKKNGKTVHEFDLKNSDVTKSWESFPPTAHVFHLAAQVFSPKSWEDPASFYRINMMGTLNALEYCRRTQAGLTLFSSYVYGKPARLPVSEEDPTFPANPYSHSKLLAEELCRFYSKAYQLAVTIFRPFNLYGCGQRGDFLIPHIIRQVISADEKEVKVADLEPKRDFLYLEDAIDALMLSLNRKGFEIFNLGSGSSYSVREMIQIIQKLAKSDKAVRDAGTRRADEVMDVRADIRKAKAELGWIPNTSLQIGLAKTIERMMND